MALAVRRISPPVQQFGDRAMAQRDESQKMMTALGGILGPIPRYLYAQLANNPDQLALQVKQRWMARKLQMSTRTITDSVLLRYADPERVQDHWRNFWTGAPLKKLEHANTLSIGVYNWPRAVVEAYVGLLAGNKPMAYQLDVRPRMKGSQAAIVQGEIQEEVILGWQEDTDYPITYTDRVTNVASIGRNWNGVFTDPHTRKVKAINAWPGSVAAFWQEDQRTLESVTVSTEMLPGVAASMYPKAEALIQQAVQPPQAFVKNFALEHPWQSWDLNSTVTLLQNWYRTTKGTIGLAVVLLNTRGNGGLGNAALLENTPDTGYTDIPFRCVPRFKMTGRAPDEAQGIIYDIAPLVTQYDEVVSAARDMLWRTFYQRFKLTNAYGEKIDMIPGTGIYKLRAGQDLNALSETLNTVPIEQFITRLEEMIMVFPGLSRFFLGSSPPSETSGEAIAASINASITRLATTFTELGRGESWQYGQLATQMAKWGGPLAPLFKGQAFDYVIGFLDANPQSATKAKQLILAAKNAGIISLDTAMQGFGVVSVMDEQRKIRAEKQDVVMNPAAVALTMQARSSAIAVFLAEQRAKNPPPPPPAEPPVKIAVSGIMSPAMADAVVQMQEPGLHPQPSQPSAAGAGGGSARDVAQNMAGPAKAITDTVQGNGKPPVFENDNQPTGETADIAPQ